MEACIHIANIAAEYDQDGVDLYFLNWEMSFHNITVGSLSSCNGVF